MSIITKQNLRERGTHLVNSRLAAGGALSQAVLTVHGPVTGAFAPLPAGINSEALANLDDGNVTSIADTINWLVNKLQNAFPQRSRLDLLVEDSWAKPTDVRGDREVSRLRISERECVIYALEGARFSEPEVGSLFREVMSFLFTGFIVDLTNAPQVADRAVTASELAAHVRWVFVSAFDREGVVISELDRQIRPDDANTGD